MKPLHDNERAFHQQGRTDMRDEIVADLDRRLAILTESIANTLMVTLRVLQVARADYASRS